MYHEAIRCNVSGNIGTKPLGTPRAPVWCEEDQSACVKGPKQMIYWNQASGNNIVVPAEYDASGVELKSPRYSAVCGFEDGPCRTPLMDRFDILYHAGAQNDIFDDYRLGLSLLIGKHMALANSLFDTSSSAATVVERSTDSEPVHGSASTIVTTPSISAQVSDDLTWVASSIRRSHRAMRKVGTESGGPY
jgi:hypothetical protein